MAGRAIHPESIIVVRKVPETWIGDFGVAIKPADSAVRVKLTRLKLPPHKLEHWEPKDLRLFFIAFYSSLHLRFLTNICHPERTGPRT
jgi:hypothetical protein